MNWSNIFQLHQSPTYLGPTCLYTELGTTQLRLVFNPSLSQNWWFKIISQSASQTDSSSNKAYIMHSCSTFSYFHIKFWKSIFVIFCLMFVDKVTYLQILVLIYYILDHVQLETSGAQARPRQLGKPSKEKTGNILVFYQYWGGGGGGPPPTNIFPFFSLGKNIYSLKMIYMLRNIENSRGRGGGYPL